MRIGHIIFSGAFLALALSAASVSHATNITPLPPCMPGGPSPEYAPTGGPPSVAVFHNAEIDGPENCFGSVQGEMKLVVALAGRFNSDLSLAELAARIGAVSSTKGLIYWSTTNKSWRQLISEAFAVADPADITSRPDFSAAEIMSGNRLYFAQNDTRSSGLNVYEIKARHVAPNRLTVEIVNTAPVKLVFFPLFGPGDLISVHSLTRLESGAWGYFGLAAIRSGGLPEARKSLINRAGAFYRFLAGIPSATEPPLAP